MHPDMSRQEIPREPQRSYARTFGRLLPFDLPPRHSQDKAPPPYSEWDGMKATGGGRLSAIRSGKGPRNRGGWKRIILLLIFAILVIVGLVMGLVVGLHDRRHHS